MYVVKEMKTKSHYLRIDRIKIVIFLFFKKNAL